MSSRTSSPKSDTFNRHRAGRQSAGPPVVGTPRYVNSGSERRELLSDFLLVKLPDLDNTWVPFRDVFQVDGKPVRERQDRLAKLILHPTAEAIEQAQQIVTESTRYNIGDLQRTINMPLLALAFLQPISQARFKYSLGKEDPSVGPGVWIVNYQERARPTFVHGLDERDLFAGGRVWIEGVSGRVVKTEVIIQDGGLRATIATSFRPDERFHLHVPFEMVEEYVLPNRSRISGRATYSRFRRFDVTATRNSATVSGRWMTEPFSGMVLVEVPRGQFAMGSTESEGGRNPDEPIHRRHARRPVLSRAIRGHATGMADGDGHRTEPLRRLRVPVSGRERRFTDVQQFLVKLNARSSREVRFRLPTEAEWEYACRAGGASPFWTGDDISPAQANYDGRRPYGPSEPGLYRGRPTAVGSFDSNPWGLLDMHGNVWEWTADRYGPYPADASIDPHGPAAGNKRVVRGGSWNAAASAARCAMRNSYAPEGQEPSLGFRVAADLIAPN